MNFIGVKCIGQDCFYAVLLLCSWVEKIIFKWSAKLKPVATYMWSDSVIYFRIPQCKSRFRKPQGRITRRMESEGGSLLPSVLTNELQAVNA